eukprot:6120949-Pyramimonas_sp.AAC.1
MQLQRHIAASWAPEREREREREREAGSREHRREAGGGQSKVHALQGPRNEGAPVSSPEASRPEAR